MGYTYSAQRARLLHIGQDMSPSQICETRAIVSGIPEYSANLFISVPGTPGDVEMHGMYGQLGFESGQLGFDCPLLLVGN